MNSYFLTRRHKYSYAILFTLGNAIFVTFLFYVARNFTCLYVYFIGLGIINTFFIFQKIRNEHIVVLEKGIEYHSPGIIVEANWEDFETITFYWYQGARNECLLIDNSHTRLKKWSFPARYPPTTLLESLRQKTIIPLSCFSENWRDSELGQQIKLYAPHLFK